ncbi:putative plant organelle RNA recognition domain-containing protein [Helianthus annuus]|nr:putative plant organelle RNA recognition domain-containing protein [Helianthus annuus]KAJ0920799.1 putative plant organelle RNA recognition domain-containing protein [Helianthus annuus]
MMKIPSGKILINTYMHNTNFHLLRRFSLWSTKKDPDLEAALTRNSRWIVNNQIKNIILRCPDHVASVNFLQKKFKTLDLQGKALNWVKKYPCCFEVYFKDDEYQCRLTKKMMLLVQEEETVKDMQETVFVERLAKLLMMVSNHRLNVSKLNEIKNNLGLPDDYLIRIIPKHLDMFRVVNYGGRKNSMQIELIKWDPELAVSKIERKSKERVCNPSFTCSLPSTWVKSWERFREFDSLPYISPYTDPGHLVNGLKESELAVSKIERKSKERVCNPSFTCSLPSTWVKSWERFREFDSLPYISPYTDPGRLVNGSKESEKRTIGLLHEFLSLTLWKKASIMKLGHFTREFRLPERLNVLLLKHPGIFYVSNKYRIYTVLLREGYNGSELVEKDPLVVVKDKFGELMQEGLHEYNRRRHMLNLEKKRKKGVIAMKQEKNEPVHELSDEGDDLGGIFDPEERKRFYKILFEEKAR